MAAAARALWLSWLLLAAAATSSQAAGVSEREQYFEGAGPLYHTTNAIHTQLRATPGIKNLALRDAATNQTQQMFRVGGTGARAAAAAGPLPTVLLICNQHARELITAELCFWLLRALARDTKTLNEWPEVAAALNATAAAARAAGRAGPIPRTLDQWASRINSRLRVEVVPVMNQEGRNFIARTFAYGQRKTVGSRVDLNRNWVTHRAVPGSGLNELDPEGEEYQGPAALSEWQTRSVHAYASSLGRKALWVDVHSGTWSLMTPYGGVFDFSNIPADTIGRWQRMLDAMQPPFRSADNKAGISAGLSSGMMYASQGSADDTAFVDVGFPYVLTVEVYTQPDSPDSGIGWRCPTLAEQQAACTEANMCGDAVCRNADGELMRPSAGKHAHAARHAGAAQASAASATAAPAQAPAGALDSRELDVSADPYLRGLAESLEADYFLAFNPATAAHYRTTVAKWLAALLAGMDHVAANLPPSE